LNIEDSWGGDIVTAAIAHLAQSTKPEMLLCRSAAVSLLSIIIKV
jgi:hypothetical protein